MSLQKYKYQVNKPILDLLLLYQNQIHFPSGDFAAEVEFGIIAPHKVL